MKTIADDDARLWKHVDHDVSRVLELHAEINGSRWNGYPVVVRRALNVAYAVAFRSVMEFLHSSRPNGKTDSRHITSKGLVGEAIAPDWTEQEKERHEDADKLVAHMSKGRVDREAIERDWGDEEDRALWDDHLRRLIEVGAISYLCRSQLGRRCHP